MTFVQLAIVSTTLLVIFVFLGGRKFPVKLVRNVAGGLGVIAGLTWHSALGLADSSFAYKIGFILAGYFLAMGLLRTQGVQE